MSYLLVIGDWEQANESLELLYHNGYHLLVTQAADELLPLAHLPLPGVLLTALPAQVSVELCAMIAHQHKLAWLVWNRNDDPALSTDAYQAGALAVLPGATTAATLLKTIRNTFLLLQTPPSTFSNLHRHPYQHQYQRGTSIPLDQDTVLEIQSGVVSLTATHGDGTEVLIGLRKPEQILIGKRYQRYFFHIEAHTDVTTNIRPWCEVIREDSLPEKLRSHIQHFEDWIAMQAHPYVESRIMGLLTLLAEQFGDIRAECTVINVHITHAQMAAAVGTTRATVTRTLGILQSRGVLTKIGLRGNERLCLRRGRLSRS